MTSENIEVLLTVFAVMYFFGFFMPFIISNTLGKVYDELKALRKDLNTLLIKKDE